MAFQVSFKFSASKKKKKFRASEIRPRVNLG